MNECLDSDEDDEEDHRGLFSGFEYLHGKSCANVILPCDHRQRSLTTQCAIPVLPVKDANQPMTSPVFMYSKQSGLIT